jgi:hypothetical protein
MGAAEDDKRSGLGTEPLLMAAPVSMESREGHSGGGGLRDGSGEFLVGEAGGSESPG